MCVLFSGHTKRTIKYQSKRKRKNITEKIFEKKFQKSFTVVGGAAYPYIVVFGGEAGRLYLYKDADDAPMGHTYMAGKWSEHV